MKHKSVYLALVILFSLTNTSVSSAQGAIAAGTIMGGIITQLENSIATLIDQLDNRVSARSFQMRTELVFLQDEIAHTAESLAYKTFSELSNQQQIFFENATTTVDSVRSSLKQADAEIDSLATQIEQVAAQFPFVGEEPRIRKSTPVFLKELPNAENSVPVQIVGSFLKHGGVVLSVGNDECKVTGHNDSSASFVCPGKAFPLRGNKVTYLSGSLTVHQKMSFWEISHRSLGQNPLLKITNFHLQLFLQYWAHTKLRQHILLIQLKRKIEVAIGAELMIIVKGVRVFNIITALLLPNGR